MSIDWIKPPPPPKTLEEAYALILELFAGVQVLRQENESLRRENLTLRQENVALKQHVAILEERLGLNSKNSSLPPSKELSSGKKPKHPKLQKGFGKRNRGGQKGHQGQNRALIDLADIQKVELRPQHCPDCDSVLIPLARPPHRHQVFEIPPIVPEVTEYQRYFGCCQACNQTIEAPLPKGVPAGILGKRALSLISCFSGKYHLSKRHIQDIFHDCFSLDLSLGCISKAEGQVSEMLQGVYGEAQSYVQNQSNLRVDESSYKHGNSDGSNPKGKKGWLWVAASEQIALYKCSLSRSQAMAKELLGEGFAGIVNSDRHGAYNWLPLKQRQICWSHLIRDFVRISERNDESSEIGEGLLEASEELFKQWHRLKAGEIKRSSFQIYAHWIRTRVRSLLEQGADYPLSKGDKSPRAKSARTCQKLLKQEAAMWTFVRIEGIEPTNNDAERAIRGYVMWRKRSYGVESERGARFVERIMTVVESCRRQGRNVLDYLTEVIQAKFMNLPPPSLVPQGQNPQIGLLMAVGS
jgi:transposase